MPTLCRPLTPPQFETRTGLPDMVGTVLTGCGYASAIGRNSDRIDRVAMTAAELDQVPARDQVTDADGFAALGDGECFAPRDEGKRRQSAGVIGKAVQFLPRGEIPHAEYAVNSTGHQRLAVRRERQKIGAVGAAHATVAVGRVEMAFLLARGKVEQTHKR